MRVLALAILATLATTEAFGQPALMNLLAESLEFRLDWDAYRNDEARLTIEICPTNVCERFTSSRPDLESFLQFVDVYVVFASHYGDLRSVSGGRVPPIPYIAARLGRIEAADVLASACGSELSAVSISCTLRQLVTELQLEKSMVRYDQGTNVVPDPGWIGAELGAANIAASLDWCASFDLSMPAALLAGRTLP